MPAEMCDLQGLMESKRTALQGKVFFEVLHHIQEGEKKDRGFFTYQLISVGAYALISPNDFCKFVTFLPSFCKERLLKMLRDSMISVVPTPACLPQS